MIDTDKHEKILKEYELQKQRLAIYKDRSEEHPNGAYKFRQKEWQVRRFIGDAKSAGYTLTDMKTIYDEAIAEVKRYDELFSDCLAKLEFYVRRFGIESLVEMIEGEEE